jgi:hypothetical protein
MIREMDTGFPRDKRKAFAREIMLKTAPHGQTDGR